VRKSRMRFAAAGAAIAVSVLAAAGCTSGLPTSSASSGSVPPTRPLAPRIGPLASAIVLQPVVSQLRIPPPSGKAGRFRCRPGFAFLPGPGSNPALCYKQIGKPVTIASAAVFRSEDLPRKFSLAITLAPGDRAALTAVTTRAVGHQLAIIVAGKAWAILVGQTPLTHGMFEIPGLSRIAVNLLQGALVHSG
jgi:hypothetical protein